MKSVGLECKDGDLLVFYQRGQMGFGAGSIPKNLQQAVIEGMVKKAGLERKSRGKIPVTLLGVVYEVMVEEYDSFGQSAFTLTWKKAKNAK